MSRYCEVIARRTPKFDHSFGEARTLRHAAHAALLHLAVCRILEHEACARHTLYNLTPKKKLLVRNLVKVIEAAEHRRRVSAAPLRHILHRGRRHVTEQGVIVQTQRFFEEKLFVICRSRKAVGKHIIDRRQSRRIEPADRRHLHGSGAMGESGESFSARCMTGKIDEDVDLVRVDSPAPRVS